LRPASHQTAPAARSSGFGATGFDTIFCVACRRHADYRQIVLRIILNKKPVFWLLLSIPALLMMRAYLSGEVIAMDMLHPTGEWSARLMIFAMILSPLVSLLGPKPWLGWLVQRRRSLGVAAFLYAVLHLIFYLVDMGNLKDILAEFWTLGIWTGWAAMLLFVPLAMTSNDASMRALKAGWKQLQRLVYPAAVLVLVHWIFIHNNLGPALVHFIPLILLVAARYFLSPKPQPTGA
jgi:methionine sulfoxide reductase heme-binding subunit